MILKHPNGTVFRVYTTKMHREYARGTYSKVTDWLAAGCECAWGRTRAEALTALKDKLLPSAQVRPFRAK
jgi:hypothetical protein